MDKESIPLLKTKLHIPPRRLNLVPRPRLMDLLEDALRQQRRLTLVSARAGSGKTTLVSEWLHQQERRFVWLSLDGNDNDPTRFLTYFIAALQTITANIGAGVLSVLQSHQPPPIESILTALLNEITTISDSFLVVLDDYHVIDSKPVDHALAFLLEHLPAQMHLVITTREDPQLPLPRLRAKGQLTELRAADLRFTLAEATDFLNQVMGLKLSAEDIATLETRTEGWIAGLQLAALSMQGRSDAASFIQAFTGSHRFVLDYLVEEVLQQQSEDIRSFLLQTAILDTFCAPLCNAVTERKNGKEILDILERRNMFLIPLDDKRHWYRYHHLFADVLQTHLMEAEPDQVANLHGRASAWYEQNGLRSDAIVQALAAEDFERAADLIELAWPAAEAGSIQPTIWLGWVKMLPEALVHTRPVLNVGYAYALLGRGEIEAAEARFKDAERWLEPVDTMKVQPVTPSVETSPESFDYAQDKLLPRMTVVDQEQFKSLPATIAVGRAYIAQALGNHPDAISYASQVLELVPEGDSFRHGQASMLLGMTYWACGDLEAAGRVFVDYTMKLRTAGNIPDAISTSVVLADIRLALGHLHEAIKSLEQLLQFVMDQCEPISPDTADLHRELSKLHLEQGNLEAAERHLQSSKELGEKAQLPVLRYRLCIDQARLKTAQGDLEGALTLLDEAQRLYIRSPLPDFCPISAMKTRVWVAQGKLTKAQGWVREQGLSTDDDLGYLREFEQVTLAKVLIARYKSDRVNDFICEAVELLERLLNAAEIGGRTGSMIEILVLQALAYEAQSNILRAVLSLEHALALAEPEGYIRIFVEEGQPIAALLKRIEAKERTLRMRVYILKLLSAFEVHKANEPEVRSAKDMLVEPFSKRELEVLRLLRSELSGPEIAQQLIVSLNTVRTHTQNIYAKLGVNNRRAAVRRAEELDLL